MFAICRSACRLDSLQPSLGVQVAQDPAPIESVDATSQPIWFRGDARKSIEGIKTEKKNEEKNRKEGRNEEEQGKKRTGMA